MVVLRSRFRWEVKVSGHGKCGLVLHRKPKSTKHADQKYFGKLKGRESNNPTCAALCVLELKVQHAHEIQPEIVHESLRLRGTATDRPMESDTPSLRRHELSSSVCIRCRRFHHGLHEANKCGGLHVQLGRKKSSMS